MKLTVEMRLFLIAMFVNMVITFFLGHLFKDWLIRTITPAIYYQAIVFISLSLPYLIKHFDRKHRLRKLEKRIKKLKSSVTAEAQETLDKKTKAMFDKVVNTNVTTQEEIKDIHDEMESLTK